MPLARGLAVGDGVAPDAELAREGRLESFDERGVALDPPERLGDPDRAADLGSGEESLAADVERDPGDAHRALDGGQLGVGADEDGDRPVRGAGRDERPDRGGHPGQLRLVGREAADLRRGSRRQARDEALRRPRRGSRLTLVGCGPARGEDPVGEPRTSGVER